LTFIVLFCILIKNIGKEYKSEEKIMAKHKNLPKIKKVVENILPDSSKEGIVVGGKKYEET